MVEAGVGPNGPTPPSNVIKSRDRHNKELYRSSVQLVESQQRAIHSQKSAFIAAAARAATNKPQSGNSAQRQTQQAQPTSPRQARGYVVDKQITAPGQQAQRPAKLSLSTTVAQQLVSASARYPDRTSSPLRPFPTTQSQPSPSSAIGALTDLMAGRPSRSRQASIDDSSWARSAAVAGVRSRTNSSATSFPSISNSRHNSVSEHARQGSIAALQAPPPSTHSPGNSFSGPSTVTVVDNSRDAAVKAVSSLHIRQSSSSISETKDQNATPSDAAGAAASLAPNVGLSSPAPARNSVDYRAAVIKALPNAAAARASMLRSVDVPAKEPLPNKLLGSLSAALKRDSSHKAEEPNTKGRERNLMIEQSAARLSAYMDKERKLAPSSLSPNSSSDSKAQSALAAALKARPNAESAVAEIELVMNAASRRRGGKRYRPATSWSAAADVQNDDSPFRVPLAAAAAVGTVATSMGAIAAASANALAGTRPAVRRFDSTDTKLSQETQGSTEGASSTLITSDSSVRDGTLTPASRGTTSRPTSSRTSSSSQRSFRSFFGRLNKNIKPTLELVPKSVDHAAREIQQAHQHIQDHHERHHQAKRAPPPAQTNNRTMRKVTKSKFNEERPWKNHQSAKFLSEKERKRYERLWAANRGSHVKYLFSDIALAQEYFGTTDVSAVISAPQIAAAAAMAEVISGPERSMPPPSLSTSLPPDLQLHLAPNISPQPLASESALSLSSGPSSSAAGSPPLLSVPLYIQGDRGSRSSVDTAHSRKPSFDARSIRSHVSTHSIESAERELRQSLDDVHGYAVARLWRRSMLGDDVLRQIWDLVDNNKDGTLDRESFIVGMWLVDQCLYGRKLPTKIDDTLWSSVGRLHLKVRVKKKDQRKIFAKGVLNAGHAAGHHGLKAVRKVVYTPTHVRALSTGAHH